MNVSFPGLGLEFSIDKVCFTIFSIPIYWYGVIIAFGFAMGILFASYAASKLGEKKDIVLDIALVCAPCAIIFARAYYVIFSWDDFKGDLMSIFDIRSGGIAIYGAVIGAVIAAYVYCRIKHKDTLKVFDIGSVGLITGQMIGRWGNFVNQEAFGSNTTLPWAMEGDGIRTYLASLASRGYDVSVDLGVHPTFLYESLWCLMVLVALLVIIKKHYKYSGQVFFAYCSLYGLGRFFIEGLRTDSLMFGAIRVSQALALVCFIVFLVLYIVRLKKKA